VGEGQISYAGPGALERAELARQILRERLSDYEISELRFDLIGVNAIHGELLSQKHGEPYEVRLRAAGRAGTMKVATMVPREVEALYTNGPSGGGGVTGSMKEMVAILSTLIPREAASSRVDFEVS
jgi:hypothetical protein